MDLMEQIRDSAPPENERTKLQTSNRFVYDIQFNEKSTDVIGGIFLPEKQLPQGEEFSKEPKNRSLKEKSTAKRLEINS